MNEPGFAEFVGGVACEVKTPARVWFLPECPAGAPTRIAVGVLREHLLKASRGDALRVVLETNPDEALLLQMQDGALRPAWVPLTDPRGGLQGSGRDGLIASVRALASAPAVLLLRQREPCVSVACALRNSIFAQPDQPAPVALTELARLVAPRPLLRVAESLELFAQLAGVPRSDVDWGQFLASLDALPPLDTEEQCAAELRRRGFAVDASAESSLFEQLLAQLAVSAGEEAIAALAALRELAKRYTV